MAELFHEITFIRDRLIQDNTIERFSQNLDPEYLRGQCPPQLITIQRTCDLVASNGFDRIRHRCDETSGSRLPRLIDCPFDLITRYQPPGAAVNGSEFDIVCKRTKPL